MLRFQFTSWCRLAVGPPISSATFIDLQAEILSVFDALSIISPDDVRQLNNAAGQDLQQLLLVAPGQGW
jgi:hypothetical protein